MKSGEFSDNLFEGVKLNYLKEHLKNLEDLETRGYLLANCFIQNMNWEEKLAVAEKVNYLTKDDIMRICKI